MTLNAAATRQGKSGRKVLESHFEPSSLSSPAPLPDFASVIDQAPDAILLIDDDGSIVYANPSVGRLFGVDPDGLPGQCIQILIPAGSPAGQWVPGASALRGIAQFSTGDVRKVLQGRRADGREFPIDVHFAPVERGTGRWTMAVVRDATDQVRILDEVRAAKRAAEEVARVKGEFLGFAAHDLSQPVQTLELMINAIEQRAQHSSDFAELSVLAKISLARMRELLKMLLEISRIDSGALKINEEPIQIAEIFAYLERQFGPVARAKALAFVSEPSNHIIEADPILLRGMLSNLVSNAIRYTRSGEVRVQAAVHEDGDLSLSVLDTGIGIPGDQLQTIFQDFRRLEAAERMAGEGFGLGLGIVRRLSSLLEFPVTVQSSIGRGSIFSVDIPAAKVFSQA